MLPVTRRGIAVSLIITTKSQTKRGPAIKIHCPLCKVRSVKAQARDQVDEVALFYVIPLFRLRNTFLKCSKCEQQIISTITSKELASYSADELSPYLSGRASFIGNFLAIAGVLLCWAPIIGILLAIVGTFINRRSPGWPRTVSLIGVVLSVFGTITFFILQAMGVVH